MYDEDEIEDKYIKYNLKIKNNESNEFPTSGMGSNGKPFLVWLLDSEFHDIKSLL